MRHVPELHFHYDESFDRGERIDNLLRDLPDLDKTPGEPGDDTAQS
jgi:ribosome-binding factor A